MRKSAKVLSVVVVLCTLLATLQTISFAEPKVLKTYYHLDVGVYFTWRGDAGGAYDKGAPNTNIKATTNIQFKPAKTAAKFRIKEIYAYKPNDTRFKYPKDDNESYRSLPENEKALYYVNETGYNKTFESFKTHYFDFSMTNLTVSPPRYNNKTGILSFDYIGTLKSSRRANYESEGAGIVPPEDEDRGDFNTQKLLVEGERNGIEEIRNYMSTIPPDMEANFRDYVYAYPRPVGASGFAYFVPMVIVYEEIAEVLKIAPPKVNLICGGPMTMGQTITVQGNVQNPNPYAVECDYVLKADGKVIKSGTGIIGANGARLSIEQPWKVPKYEKAGYVVKFELSATIRPQNPPPGNENLSASGRAECLRSAIPVNIIPPKPGVTPVIIVE